VRGAKAAARFRGRPLERQSIQSEAIALEQ
jgi:hypothetical protein